MTTDEKIETRRLELSRLNVNGGSHSNLPQQTNVGLGPSNLEGILMGSQAKVDKLMSDLADKVAAVEARVGFTEKVTITAEAIVIERQVTMAKDRKY